MDLKTAGRLWWAGVAGLALVILCSGCIPRCPTQTVPPVLDVPHWEAKTVRSASGHEYQYLVARGPTETAPTAVLLHGGIFDHHMWINMIGLSERFHLVALRWPDNSLFFNGQVGDWGEIAADFVKALKLNNVVVAGVSAGAYGAVELATGQYGIDVTALLLFSSVMYSINQEEIEKRTAMASRALGFAPHRLLAFIEWRVNRTDFAKAPGQLQQKDIFYTRSYNYYYQLFSSAFNQGSARQVTNRVTCPTLFVQGTADDMMLIEVARLNPTLFPNAELKEMAGLEHDMVFSHGPELVPVVFEFLDRQSEK